MLMTKFIFTVHQAQDGSLHTVVTRVSDQAQKYFYQANGTVEGMTKFMMSMTDDLTEGYFPKPGKNGKSTVDNWAFLGPNPDRVFAEEQARGVDLTHAVIARKV